MYMDIVFDFVGWHRMRSIGLTPYALAVLSYESPGFPKASRKIERDFYVDIIDLAYATARTLCSHHVRDQELYFDVMASLLSHLNLIHENNAGYLVVSQSRYKRLRDFSRKTRIGELGQAINALFVADRLKYPFVIDFDLAKRLTAGSIGIRNSKKSPDFVVVDKQMTKLGLLESKGSAGASSTVWGLSGKLAKAQAQIDAVDHPCFDVDIPACVRFENNGDLATGVAVASGNSSVNYALIENTCASRGSLLPLVRRHYVSWFYLVRDFDRVQGLLDVGNIPQIQVGDDPRYEYDEITDKGNPIFWVKVDSMFREKLGYGDFSASLRVRLFGPRDWLKIGIYKSVVDFLADPEAQTFDYPTDDRDSIGNSNRTGLRRFPDGTVIMVQD